jgi:hypothetical protein
MYAAVLLLLVSVLTVRPAFGQTCDSDAVPDDGDVHALIARAVRLHYEAPRDAVKCTSDDQSSTWWVISLPNRFTTKPPATLTYVPDAVTRLAIQKNAHTLLVFTPDASWRVRLDNQGNVLRTWVRDFNGHAIPRSSAPPSASAPATVHPEIVDGDQGCVDFFAARAKCIRDEWNKLTTLQQIKEATALFVAAAGAIDCAIRRDKIGCSLTALGTWADSKDICPQFNDRTCINVCQQFSECTHDSGGIPMCPHDPICPKPEYCTCGPPEHSCDFCFIACSGCPLPWPGWSPMQQVAGPGCWTCVSYPPGWDGGGIGP